MGVYVISQDLRRRPCIPSGLVTDVVVLTCSDHHKQCGLYVTEQTPITHGGED